MVEAMKRFLSALRYFTFLIPAAAALLFGTLWSLSPALAEQVHARVFFPILSLPISFFTSLLPLSLTELCCVAALPLLLVLLVVVILRLIRKNGRLLFLKKTVRACGWALSSAFLLYMLLHGFNFYRLTVAQNLELDMGEKSPEQLLAVCIDLAEKAAAERQTLEEDGDGVMKLKDGVAVCLSHAPEYIDKVKKQYDFFGGQIGHWFTTRPKGVFLSHYWSYTGITGMYFPFFAEANINVDIEEFSIPYTVCHELSHTFGFAREDEANFLSYLLCTGSSSAEYRYSGYASAYISCSNALYRYDKKLWEEASGHVSAAMWRDFNAQSRYWKQFEGEVMQAASSVNDSFLKAQNQQDGVLSYDRVVALILAHYEKEGRLPE